MVIIFFQLKQLLFFTVFYCDKIWVYDISKFIHLYLHLTQRHNFKYSW